MDQFAIILAAAGKSSRFSKDRTGRQSGETTEKRDCWQYKKPFILLKGKAVWLYSAEKFASRPEVREILLVIAPEDREHVENRFAAELARWQIELVDGGSERFRSVENALRQISSDIDYIAIHDAARPCLTDQTIDRVFSAARRTGAAIPANPVNATLKRGRTVESNEISEERWKIVETVDRKNLWQAQTPQVFRHELLLKAYQNRGELLPTDDAQLLEALGYEVELVPADPLNIKITTAIDLETAEKFLEIEQNKR